MGVRVKIEKWEDLNSPEIIYKLIRTYELEVGEDFVDQNEYIVRPIPFAYYLFGKGLVSKELLNNLLKEGDPCVQYFLDGYEEPYAIFPLGEGTYEAGVKKYHLLADIISTTDILKRRLFKILSEITYKDKEGNQITLVLTDKDFEANGEGLQGGTLEDEWQYVLSHSIEDINEILKCQREGEE